MGMYTEIFVNAEINDGAIEILRYMLGLSAEKPELPDHPLFKTSRWDYMLRCSSYYHIPFATMELRQDATMKYHYLTGRSDLKNYDDEIDKFFDWLTPYVDATDGQFIGYSRYEEDLEPKLYHKRTA